MIRDVEICVVHWQILNFLLFARSLSLLLCLCKLLMNLLFVQFSIFLPWNILCVNKIVNHLIIVMFKMFNFLHLLLNNGWVFCLVVSWLVSLMVLLILSRYSLLLWVISFLWFEIQLFSSIVDCVVFYDFPNYLSHVLFVGQSFKQCSYSIKLRIGHIIIPRNTRNGILRLKHKSNWWIIHNYHISHWPTQSCKILDKSIIVKCTVLSKQFVRAETLWIKLSDQWFRIFWKTCSEYNHFIVFTHSLKEAWNTWSYQNVNLANLPLNLDWQYNISILNRFELRVDKGLIQVENKSFSSNILFALWADQPLLLLLLTSVFFVLSNGLGLHLWGWLTLWYLTHNWT